MRRFRANRISFGPNVIAPKSWHFLREPLEDLCISRPTSRLQWGISMPFDDNYVTYVWFDALLNYVSALQHRGADSLSSFWPKAQHLIAKDILKPHAIYWPTMLMAAGLPLYDHLNVHGYWVMDSGKMSKSLGNVIRPLEMKARFGMDAFRYFLLREMAFGQDAKFSEESFDHSDQRRSGEQFGQPGEPRVGDAAKIFRRRGAAVTVPSGRRKMSSCAASLLRLKLT